jgi:hypothetical protein
MARKLEITLSPLNDRNSTLNIKSVLSKGKKLECIVLITEGLPRLNGQVRLESVR